jgi:Negative regulator of sigma F
MDDTEGLIAQLTEGLQPVKRLPSPGVRASLWLGVIALLGAAIVFGFSDLAMFVRRISDPKLALELTGTLLTGILAVIAAFELSLPDRPLRWVLLPAPSFVLWLGSSGYSCWRHWLVRGPDGLTAGEGADCFLWIVAFGVPLAVSLFIVLRRAHPLAPGPVAAMAGLGVASLAAFLLQFFHPFDVTFIDLGLHLAAVATVIILARAAARRGLNAF